MGKPKHKIWRRLGFALLCLLTLCIWAFYDGITVPHYVYRSEKMSQEKLRIVLAADLHSYVYGEKQADLLELIRKQSPDLIVMAGDIADNNSYPIEGTKWLMEGAAQIAPCYYVTGNHEFWSIDVPNLKEAIRSVGVTVLEGDRVSLDWHGRTINLCGVDDPDGDLMGDKRENYMAALGGFDSLPIDEVNILVAHRPEYIEDYARYPFDLVLSGHAHGGQVRIPLLLNGLFAPDQGWYPEYAGGEYRAENTTMIISRGLSYYPRLPRIFNPPELVVIDLFGEQ